MLLVRAIRHRVHVAVRAIAFPKLLPHHQSSSNSESGTFHWFTLEQGLLPLLGIGRILYQTASALHRSLYWHGILEQKRLPVPVVSVGNLTWGGNGKTPMVEFIAHRCMAAGVVPLILTRGYGGGDEVRLFQRHLSGSPAVLGVGPNRASVAIPNLEARGVARAQNEEALLARLGWQPATSESKGNAQYTRMDDQHSGACASGDCATSTLAAAAGAEQVGGRLGSWEGGPMSLGLAGSVAGLRQLGDRRVGAGVSSRGLSRQGGLEQVRRRSGKEERLGGGQALPGVGVAILDDGMQHYAVVRDLELVMVNAVSVWGNGRLVPRGPLREPLGALARVHVVAIHHADLVHPDRLREIQSEVASCCRPGTLVVHTRMVPTRLHPLCQLSPPAAPAGHPASASWADESAPAGRARGVRPGAEMGTTGGSSKDVSAPDGDPPAGKSRCDKLPGGGSGAEVGTTGGRLEDVRGAVVLSVSGIGCPEALRLSLEQMGARQVASLDFGDHHQFSLEDLEVVKKQYRALQTKHAGQRVMLVFTEKDFVRDTRILRQELGDCEGFVLCSHLEFMSGKQSVEAFDKLLVAAMCRPLTRASLPFVGPGPPGNHAHDGEIERRTVGQFWFTGLRDRALPRAWSSTLSRLEASPFGRVLGQGLKKIRGLT